MIWTTQAGGSPYARALVKLAASPPRPGLPSTRRACGSARPWYFDPTPNENSEFDVQQTLYADLPYSQQTAYFKGSPPDLLEVGVRGSAVSTGSSTDRPSFGGPSRVWACRRHERTPHGRRDGGRRLRFHPRRRSAAQRWPRRPSRPATTITWPTPWR